MKTSTKKEILVKFSPVHIFLMKFSLANMVIKTLYP